MTKRNPDATLLRNCARLIAMEAELRASDDDFPEQPAGYYDLIDTVTKTTAKTEEGNRAKLAVAVSFH